ncbi:MAG: T9SS type A sorting domain-containing protein [Chitinophagales bacterium]|nr:T9SS type A sorting domain-containing protein [Chitinophagales bacterium]
MKYTFILLLFYVCPQMNLFSQKNFAPLNAEWSYENHTLDCSGDYQLFKVENEIMIDDKDCSVIHAYQWNHESSDWQSTGDTLVVWENDSEVYFLENTSFYLLFDFDMELEDTMFYYNPINRGAFSSTQTYDGQEVPNMLAYVVYDIEFVEAESGQTLRKYYVDAVYNDISGCAIPHIILENIGCMANRFTGEICFSVNKGCHGGFICYRNDTLAYDSDHLDCETFTATEEVPYSIHLKIHPNPTTDYWLLDWEYSEKAQLQLLDIQGNVIRTQAILPGQQKIPAQDLPSGIYLMKVKGDSVFGSIKVFKQ